MYALMEHESSSRGGFCFVGLGNNVSSKSVAVVLGASFFCDHPPVASSVYVEPHMLMNAVDDSIAAFFSVLASRWKENTSGYSSIQHKVRHPDYQSIISIGPRVLPYILDDLKTERHPAHWFPALKTLSNNDPVDPSQRGNILAMKKAWMKWGMANGYLDDDEKSLA